MSGRSAKSDQRAKARDPDLNPEKRRNLRRLLAASYPNPQTELVFTGEYQLVICVVLSAQCTDKKVNETTPVLFTRYPSFSALAQARLRDIEHLIRPINYYRTKAKNIIGLAAQVTKEFGGKLPRTHEELLSLPGVGNKTANVVLSELGAAKTFPVDTHVFRVSKRLGLAHGGTVEQVEEELKANFKAAHWHNLHHWLILHGRRICKAPRPLCEICPLTTVCESWKKSRGKG
jgi:endonuclease III